MKTQDICGVEFKPLKTHSDERGFFREVIRSEDEFFRDAFAQWSHSRMSKNTVKAWHFHHLQTDWWYVAVGLLEVVLFDKREESPSYGRKMEFLLGDPSLDPKALCSVLRIVPGVLHGCKVLSGEAHLMYITDRSYSPEDEGRYPYDSGVVPHSWGSASDLTVAENDKRYFRPSNPRIKTPTT